MNWNPHMELQYNNNICYPYSSAGSFIEYFEGLTYQHLNFIFSGASHIQENSYPWATSFYKYGLSEPQSSSYYGYSHGYEENHHELIDEYRQQSENLSMLNEQMATVSIGREEGVNNATRDNSIECPRRNHNNADDYQAIWQDNIDPDNMTYEELIELGDAVGTQSRGLSLEQISLLPVSKYKCCFLRKKSRDERCVICQMEYRRGDKRITLPCKHVYHAICGKRWLSINKACPICYTEVFSGMPRHNESVNHRRAHRNN